MRVLSFAVGLVGLASSVRGMFTADDDVVELTAENFETTVLDSPDVFMVEFYAPWCGHCKNLAPEWKKAATALKGIVGVGAVDSTAHPDVGTPYKVTGFPTIIAFGADKENPTPYEGARQAKAIASFAITEIKGVIRSRLGLKGGKAKKVKKPKEEEPKEEAPEAEEGVQASGDDGGEEEEDTPTAVVTLTDDNFEDEVMSSEDLWFIEFYAPWCGHCKKLAPEWKAASIELEGQSKLGEVDCTSPGGTPLCGRYEVDGYPSIKVFGKGAKYDAEEYQAGRTKPLIVSYATKLLAEYQPPAEIAQLTSDEELKETCGGVSLCVIAFLPNILDSGAEGRNGEIADLKRLSGMLKKVKMAYLWAEGYQHPQLEQALEVGGTGYPALVLYNQKKGRFVPFSGSYSVDNIKLFVDRVMKGRERTLAVSSMPTIDTVPAWDGKDGQMHEEL
jgi:protein disulfide-isomerase A6